MSHVFSDVFAHRPNPVTGIDARLKIAFTVIALGLNLLAANVYAPLAIAFFCLVVLLLIRMPPRLLLLRLAMPLVMAAVVLVTQIFFAGVAPLFTVSFWGLRLTGYEDGLARGLLMMSRVLGGVSLIMFLSMSTPANKLFLAARWFRFPQVLVELALLIYRYVFVLLEEALAIRDAQRMRLGYCGWRRSMNSIAVLGGSLVLRAYDRAERVFEAMSARGYAGNLRAAPQARPGGKDVLAGAAMIALLLLFYGVGRLPI